MGFRSSCPPLRERSEYIPQLGSHSSSATREARVELPGFTPDARRATSYNWPGNISELENESQRIVIQAESGHDRGHRSVARLRTKREGTVTRTLRSKARSKR